MPNRLAAAASPYLLQHVDNPVDWWEWGDDASAEARGRDIPCSCPSDTAPATGATSPVLRSGLNGRGQIPWPASGKRTATPT